MGLSGGDAVRKRLARRKLNLVDADINSWSCLVNSHERIMLTEELLKLVAALQKQKKSRLKSLAKDKNSSKSLALMETVKAGDNGVIEKLKRNDYVLLINHYYRNNF